MATATKATAKPKRQTQAEREDLLQRSAYERGLSYGRSEGYRNGHEDGRKSERAEKAQSYCDGHRAGIIEEMWRNNGLMAAARYAATQEERTRWQQRPFLARLRYLVNPSSIN